MIGNRIRVILTLCGTIFICVITREWYANYKESFTNIKFMLRVISYHALFMITLRKYFLKYMILNLMLKYLYKYSLLNG